MPAFLGLAASLLCSACKSQDERSAFLGAVPNEPTRQALAREIECKRGEIHLLESDADQRWTMEGLQELHRKYVELDALESALRDQKPDSLNVPDEVERDQHHTLIVSVPDQQLELRREGQTVVRFPISTSRFGTGDKMRSSKTPIGNLEIASKIGDNQPHGMHFDNRIPTGHIIPTNTGDADLVVTRILWLKGLEDRNQNALNRSIYIHGTPHENSVGDPCSSGCIRMKSADIIQLYETVGVGARVVISDLPIGIIRDH